MAEYREVRHVRLYVKEPGTERLRKSAEGMLRHLLASGWREVERWHARDYMTVKVERAGRAPLLMTMPKFETPPPRARRFGDRGPGGPGGSGGFGGRSGPGGRRGGPGGPGGPGGTAAPGAAPGGPSPR
jgi:hypothetical protein